ncbi:hypothetical protein GVAV_000152 [Gurleya vavrai]
MDDETIGECVNLIIKNHNENKLTHIKYIKQKINKENLNECLDLIARKFADFDMELIGLDNEKVISFKRAEKLFIIKCKNKIISELDLEYKKMVIIYTFIYLEGEKIKQKVLYRLLEDLPFFEDLKSIDAYVCELKSHGYLTFEKEDDEQFVFYDWRFFIEFQDFNPPKIFKHILKTQNEVK